jgi:hypothetical protein
MKTRTALQFAALPEDYIRKLADHFRVSPELFI